MDPSFLKQFILVVIGLVVGASGLAGVYGLLKKRSISPQPLEIRAAADFVTKDFCGQIHTETARRVAALDDQIRELWTTFRQEDSKTREMLAHAIRDFDQSINRVLGTLDELKENQRSILSKFLRDLS